MESSFYVINLSRDFTAHLAATPRTHHVRLVTTSLSIVLNFKTAFFAVKYRHGLDEGTFHGCQWLKPKDIENMVDGIMADFHVSLKVSCVEHSARSVVLWPCCVDEAPGSHCTVPVIYNCLLKTFISLLPGAERGMTRLVRRSHIWFPIDCRSGHDESSNYWFRRYCAIINLFEQVTC